MYKTRLGLILVIALLAACAPPRVLTPITAPPGPANFPETYYQQALTRGEAIFRIDPTQSLIVMAVHRGGSLARLGHEHVVASRDVHGYVLPDQGLADLYVPLYRLTVDEPQLRAEAGMETTPSASDIAGTRENMLTKVLRTDQYPYAVVHIVAPAGAGGTVDLTLSITLHGNTREIKIPATVTAANDRITVLADLAIKQTDFGITPYSVLGGAMQVLDRVDMHVALTANRVTR